MALTIVDCVCVRDLRACVRACVAASGLRACVPVACGLSRMQRMVRTPRDEP